MKHETIQDLIDNIKLHKDVDIDYFLNSPTIDEAIIAFALRFLSANLGDEEVAEMLFDSLA